MTTERGTPTPRTEAVKYQVWIETGSESGHYEWVVSEQASMTLERELADQHHAADLIAEERDAFWKALDDSRVECAADRKVREDAEQTMREHIAYGQEARAKWCATNCKEKVTAAEQRAERAEAVVKGLRTQEPIDALDLAIVFHHTYERLAPNMGYDTREETRIFDPESANGKLMVAVCAEVIRKFNLAALATESAAAQEVSKASPSQEGVGESSLPTAPAAANSKSQLKRLSTQTANHAEALRIEGWEQATEWLKMFSQTNYLVSRLHEEIAKRRQASAGTGLAQNGEK